MLRREFAGTPGTSEKVPDSGVWWIRLRVGGKLKREKLYLLAAAPEKVVVGGKLQRNLPSRVSGLAFVF